MNASGVARRADAEIMQDVPGAFDDTNFASLPTPRDYREALRPTELAEKISCSALSSQRSCKRVRSLPEPAGL